MKKRKINYELFNNFKKLKIENDKSKKIKSEYELFNKLKKIKIENDKKRKQFFEFLPNKKRCIEKKKRFNPYAGICGEWEDYTPSDEEPNFDDIPSYII